MAGSAEDSQRQAVAVPDETTALKIAEAVWTARYGELIVSKFRPYRVTSKDDRWTIIGTPIDGSTHGGGMPEIEISKVDGKVLSVNLSR